MEDVDFSLDFYVYGSSTKKHYKKSSLYKSATGFHALINENDYPYGWLMCDVFVNDGGTCEMHTCKTGYFIDACCVKSEDTSSKIGNYIITFSNSDIFPANGFVTESMLSESVKQLMFSSGSHVTNMPDEEDLTTTGGEFGSLKFKDKMYEPENYSGLGRVYLRKNFLNGRNVLTQSMLQWSNTIYIVRYDYDLQKATIEIPDNCELVFDGGKISNGKVILTNTLVRPFGHITDYIQAEISGNYKEGQILYDKKEKVLQVWTGTMWRNFIYQVRHYDNKLQISYDNGNTWVDITPKFENNLHIAGYYSSLSDLPTNAIIGTVYGVGPATNESGNPSYRFYVYDGTQWVDNGSFTSLSAGVVQETGDSETEVMSQKAVSAKLSDLGSKVDSLGSIKEDVTSDFSITDENGQQIVKFESGEVKTKNFSSANTPSIEEDKKDLTISDINGNEILRIIDGGIETKKFKSSNKKEYTSKYERFTIYINKTPVGKFDDKSARSNSDKTEIIVSVKGVIALPKTYTPNGEPCRLLLFAHGSSGNVTDTEWYNNKSSFINDFIPFWLSQGYAVFDCNAVPDGEARLSNGASTLSNPIGLPDNMQAYLKAYEYIITNYNVKPQMYVWACSAGGPVPLNFLFMRSGAIAAIAECGGILDIKDEIWGQSHQYPSDHKPDLAKRLGFDDVSGNTWEHDKADIWNPYSRIKEIDGKQYAFGFNAPIYILHGTNDTVLYQFEKRNTFADALINGGSICSIKWYDGFTHDDVCMGEKHVVMEDVCKWFNRF